MQANSRSGCLYATDLCRYEAKLVSLKLKTHPKQLLGYILLNNVLIIGTNYRLQLTVTFWRVGWGNGERHIPGSTKANGREPKASVGLVFNFKLGCFDDVHVLISANARPHL
jgi:hypothetical protein